ncbi:hypothetical protein E3P98_01285 [Wallemia ichthyophaga]|nr:hypothetical protein E3P98_01285 [Wallemia ichthyophaga]
MSRSASSSGSSSSTLKTAPSVNIYTSSSSAFDPFTAYAPDIQMSVHATPMLSDTIDTMQVDILQNNEEIAVLHLSITRLPLSCSKRDDLVEQELDILPSDANIRLSNKSPLELACGKMPPVSYVGGRIRSQGALHPYAVFESRRGSLFRGQLAGNRVKHQISILDDSRVSPITSFVLIIANQAKHCCVWSRNLDGLAKRYDLTQYHKSQGMIFNPAGAAGG